VREQCRANIEGGDLTVIPGDDIEMDFGESSVTYRGKSFRFPALESVPQALVIAGGIESLVRRKLGIALEQ
jgi:hypothetical protein